MIEALKSEEIVEKVGGRFHLCALIQRRLVQLMDGARPLVERTRRRADGTEEKISDLEVVVEEIMQDKLTLEFDPSGAPIAPRRSTRRFPRED